MNAYLAASPFVAFGGAAYQPEAVFAGAVGALNKTSDAAVIAALMKGQRFSLLTGALERVVVGNSSLDIEIYLLEAGLRAIPVLRAIETELRNARKTATHA